jgi:hypothetical protein
MIYIPSGTYINAFLEVYFQELIGFDPDVIACCSILGKARAAHWSCQKKKAMYTL